MTIVSFVVDAAESALADIAESQFAGVLEAFGASFMLAATIAIVLLLINMIYQIRPMDGPTLMSFIFKLALIITFALDWTNFNSVSGFITSGLDEVAGILISSVTGEEGSGPQYFASRFDDLLGSLSEYSNSIARNMNWIGGALLSVALAGLLAAVSAAAALVLVLSKMVLTILLGIAPIMITLTLFKSTSDYFQKWLSAVISWSMYPLVMAGVFSVQFGLLRLLMDSTAGPNDITSIGAALPFLAMVLISLILISAIPMIVRTLSGDINSGWAASAAATVGRKAYDMSVGRRSGGRSQQSPRPQPIQRARSTGQQMQQMADRSARLRNN